MTPFLENLVLGAASVKLDCPSDYSDERITRLYQRQAEGRGVVLDFALIAKVSAERRLGQALFSVVCLALLAAAVLVAPRNETLACALAFGPLVLFVAAALMDRHLSAA